MKNETTLKEVSLHTPNGLVTHTVPVNKKSVSISLSKKGEFKDFFKAWLNGFSNSNNIGYVAACAGVWARSFAKTKFRLYDESEDNKEVVKHPAFDILKRPNPFNFSWWQYKSKMAFDFIYEDNSYWLKLRDTLGIVRGIWHLYADRMTPYPFTNFEYPEYYEYNTGSGITKLNPEDVIRIPSPAYKNGIQGQKLINQLADVIDVEKHQQAYRKQVYTRGGFLGATFSTPQIMDARTFDRMFEQIEAKYGGEDNYGRIGLFEADVKPVSTAYSPKQIEMTAERSLNQKEISAHFGVNKLLLGESELVQRGNVDGIIYLFNSQVVDPLMYYIVECLNIQWIHPDYDSVFYVKHDIQAQRDIEQDLKYYDSGLTKGWLSVNEVRAEEGYEVIKDPAYDIPKPQSTANITAN